MAPRMAVNAFYLSLTSWDWIDGAQAGITATLVIKLQRADAAVLDMLSGGDIQAVLYYQALFRHIGERDYLKYCEIKVFY